MTLTTPAVRASESNHWYTSDGVPQYTVPSKKDGSPRNTTLRDARTMNLVPSVTTVLGVAAKPALIQWLQRQVLLAALTLPRKENEPEDDYIARIMEDSKEQGRAAADAGTDIHASIQGAYEGRPTGNHLAHVEATKNAIDAHFGPQEWISERAFAHIDLRFGGKCDMYTPKGIVIDVKTKEFSDPAKVDAYDEHLMQLAAYRVGLGVPLARCANVFVSRSVPGLVTIKEWTTEDLNRGWEMFCNLLAYWKLKNKF
jgi:hypothetical protein